MISVFGEFFCAFEIVSGLIDNRGDVCEIMFDCICRCFVGRSGALLCRR